MSASKRATLIGKLQTALKKNYKAPPAQPTRPLLEHVLYASLLQDAPAELADEGMAKCEQEFFDWNEVRVTTVTELSQVLSNLPEPVKAAQRLKSNLQAIFEEFYTFDLDHLKKENLGKATGKFEKMPGMTPFVLSYTIQHGLGGHSIPVDYCAMVIMLNTGIASQTEASSGKVTGLDRAIPKSKGIEFAALLHQAGVALYQNPKDKKARAVMDAVDKGASKQFDEWLASKKAAKKRVSKRKADERAAAQASQDAAPEAPPEKKKKASAASKTEDKQPTKKTAKKKTAKAPESVSASAPPKKKSAAKPATKKTPKKSAPKKNSGKATAKKSSTKKSAAKPAATKKTASKSSKRSANRKLTKRKPR